MNARKKREIRRLTSGRGSSPPARTRGSAPASREVWQYRRILGFFSIKAVQSLYAKTHLGVSWIFIRDARAARRRQLRVRLRHAGALRRRSVLAVLPDRAGAVELLRRSADPRKPRHRGQPAAADQTVRASHHPAARHR